MLLLKDNQIGIKKVINVLKNGGVVMHATETCYGFAADIFNEAAVKKVYELKRMGMEKPVSIMVSGFEQAKKCADFSNLALKLAEKFWPGPLTLVLPRKELIPKFFNDGNNTIGLRWPNSRVCLELIKGVGGPLTTTSANISGLPEVHNVDNYLQQAEGGDLPDIILNSGFIESNSPSTIVKVDGEDVSILRRGGNVYFVEKFIKALLY